MSKPSRRVAALALALAGSILHAGAVGSSVTQPAAASGQPAAAQDDKKDANEADKKNEKDDKKDEKKWDVTAPFGPTTPLAFETVGGDVDERRREPRRGAAGVRPARRSLHTCRSPAARATRLTSGAAFDMQPRFSPDGKSHRLHQRSQRPVQHLGDGRRRQEPEGRLARSRSGG